MSFSSDIKDELCRFQNGEPCCKFAELAGMLRAGLSIRNAGKNKTIAFITEHAAVSRLMFGRMKELIPNGVEIRGEKSTRFKRHVVYRLNFRKSFNSQQSLKLLKSIGMNIELSEGRINYTDFILQDRCCIRAYLRGGFLAVGSVTNPDKSYHVELSFTSDIIASEYMRYMEYFELKPKSLLRNNNFVVYMKEGQDIVDFLNIINAHNALLEMENIRVLKDMRNQVNRIVNCETANLGKIVDASLKQVECIRLLDRTIGIENLPINLKEIARLRLENPEASLSELGKMLSPELSKSGVNHRMRNLQQMAADVTK
ncbi:MAG TPA: DNA-binding protein WhiA [Thermoclostridium sp.]|nr:DNA-binding protein WhiA [Thermoclostridium sp.]